MASSSSFGHVVSPNSLRMSGARALCFGLMILHIYLELDPELRADIARLIIESNERMEVRSPR